MLYSIYGADGNEYGPVDVSVLAQWAREGRIVERTQVLQHATGRRFLACDLPELAAVFLAPPQVEGAALPAAVAPAGAYGLSVHPAAPAQSRSRVTAGLLGIFFGWLGVHRFYLGYTAIGIVQLLLSTLFAFFTCGATFALAVVWGFVEGVLCLAGGIGDANGMPLAP